MGLFKTTFVIVISLLTLGSSARADRIVLRNLDIISDETVEGFDEDGVRLDDGTLIEWDRIEQGRVSDEQQARFDAMLNELGSHLYRIRQRLSIRDYRGLLPHAEAVYERYRGRRGGTAYMVVQALMWSRLAVGQREAALAPYLECFECLRQAAADGKQLSLPGTRRLEFDMQTGLSPELPPVWFDTRAAGQNLAEVGKVITGMASPRPAATRIYYTTLALAAGETDKAVKALGGLEGLPQLKAIVDAQVQLSRGEAHDAIETLQRELGQFPQDLQPLALYWLGQARLADANPDVRQEGLLDLLRIPALFGTQQPELAAAGLYLAMRSLAESGDAKGSIAIRRELLDRYGQTWHAQRLRVEDEKSKRQP